MANQTSLRGNIRAMLLLTGALCGAVCEAAPCRSLAQVKASDTPLELFVEANQCIRAGRTSEAVALYAAGTAFGRYDMERVEGPDVMGVLEGLPSAAVDGLTERQGTAFFTAISQMAESRAAMAKLCQRLVRIGPPRYSPDYLTAPGVRKHIQPGRARVVPDTDHAWREVLNRFVGCR